MSHHGDLTFVGISYRLITDMKVKARSVEH